MEKQSITSAATLDDAAVGVTHSNKIKESEDSVEAKVKRRRKTPGPPRPKITTTLPENILRHDISDDELERLMEGSKKDGQSEIFWALVGGALAALPASLEDFYRSFIEKPGEQVSLLHFFEMLIFIVPAFGAMLKYKTVGKRSNPVVALGEKIRARKAN